MHKIEVSDAVYDALQRAAKPFVEKSPNDVLERLLGVSKQVQLKPPRRPGRNTPNHWNRGRIRPVLLEVLYAMGGQTRTRDAVEGVRERIAPELTDYDREIILSNKQPRWRLETLWAHNNLKDDGLLEPPERAGRGVWKLTAKGIVQVEQELNGCDERRRRG